MAAAELLAVLLLDEIGGWWPIERLMNRLGWKMGSSGWHGESRGEHCETGEIQMSWMSTKHVPPSEPNNNYLKPGPNLYCYQNIGNLADCCCCLLIICF